jgi:hypothetical protein
MLDIKELMKLSLEEREIAIYKELRQIDCSEHIEKLSQGNVTLSYLSWSWAFDTIQQLLPISYEIKQFTDESGKLVPYQYDKNTGYMVFTEMTILGIKKSMWLPVMDSANKAMKSEPYSYKTKSGDKWVQPANMFDVNKTIMRCLVKNLSLYGLGLYIYAGEDLPPKEKEYVTDEQLKEMQDLKVKVDGVLRTYGISDIRQLEKDQAQFVIDSKKAFLERQKAGATDGNTTK